MNENEQKQQGLQIEIAPDKAQGEYANFAIITHSSSEFIVDFARMLPGLPKRTSCATSAPSARLRCRSRPATRAAPSPRST